ncbi:non-claret disjunctional [Haematobia irritans]|uniref:non-claret disjunctional n=1 Tax=Haematobia irritans TaxID=7368 RepID=UPI003F4F8464
MESKLPKPSGLKKPTVARAVLPMDRIKPSTFTVNFGNKSQLIGGSSQSLSTIHPLSRDLTNFQNYENFPRRGRAASPDAQVSHASVSRIKMRRSRSACDIRDMRPNKRTESTLAPIPAKTARTMSTVIPGTNIANKPPRIGTTANANGCGAVKRQPSKLRTATAQIKNVTATSNTTSTVSSKTAPKRIPPYDYKSRYNDLLEKHKVLKEKFEDKSQQLSSFESLPDQLEDTQNQLIIATEELKTAKSNIECLTRQTKLQQEKYDSITANLSKTTEKLEILTKEYNNIKREHDQLSAEIVHLRERTSTLADTNAILEHEINVYKEQLFRSNMERKELHNTVLDLRGNIRVFCRVRPPLECEQEKLLCGWNFIDETTVEISSSDPASRNKSNVHLFTFDQVFHPSSDQGSIFEMVSPLIQSALDGYNICIFAYGQTGSGKTYTMDGVQSNHGIIPRTVDLLFESVRNYRNIGWNYEIKVTFLEIYNEVLYDLLSNEQKDMEIRMVKNSKNDIYVSNITQEIVESADRLRELMQIAKMNRATAATAGNERSSRSHAVTKIELVGTHMDKQEISIGSINLVDLAGSESPKTSTRMNETKNINRSLSELTNVILALLQKQDHIPYRNSKLTHLLMPSLGGNSKTLMFINVAPLQDCFVESLKSLRFAATVNQCKMAKAKRNRIHNNSLVNTSGTSN